MSNKHNLLDLYRYICNLICQLTLKLSLDGRENFGKFLLINNELVTTSQLENEARLKKFG